MHVNCLFMFECQHVWMHVDRLIICSCLNISVSEFKSIACLCFVYVWISACLNVCHLFMFKFQHVWMHVNCLFMSESKQSVLSSAIKFCFKHISPMMSGCKQSVLSSANTFLWASTAPQWSEIADWRPAYLNVLLHSLHRREAWACLNGQSQSVLQ